MYFNCLLDLWKWNKPWILQPCPNSNYKTYTPIQWIPPRRPTRGHLMVKYNRLKIMIVGETSVWLYAIFKHILAKYSNIHSLGNFWLKKSKSNVKITYDCMVGIFVQHSEAVSPTTSKIFQNTKLVRKAIKEERRAAHSWRSSERKMDLVFYFFTSLWIHIFNNCESMINL